MIEKCRRLTGEEIVTKAFNAGRDWAIGRHERDAGLVSLADAKRDEAAAELAALIARVQAMAERGDRWTKVAGDLDEQVQALTEERDALIAQVVTWQPIETAPKDGTRVLAWWPYWSRHPVVAWVDKLGRWSAEIALSEGENDPTPTHWMPLPEPPQ